MKEGTKTGRRGIAVKNYKVFAINPGSTSTKIAMFEGGREVFSENVSHDAGILKEFKEISDQFVYRKEMILEELKKAGQTLEGGGCIFSQGRRPGECGGRRVQGGGEASGACQNRVYGEASGYSGGAAGRCIF